MGGTDHDINYRQGDQQTGSKGHLRVKSSQCEGIVVVKDEMKSVQGAPQLPTTRLNHKPSLTSTSRRRPLLRWYKQFS
jgi:hypothetical protein